jgi:hypothetical protein
MTEFSITSFKAYMIALNLLKRILGRGKPPSVGSFKSPNPSAKIILVVFYFYLASVFAP